jgi:putative addiction module component (TIGR02574 family)
MNGLSQTLDDRYISCMDTITISDLLHLSLDERLQLVEDLWDSIAADAAEQPARLPVTDAQRAEILRRSEAHRRNPGEAIPLDEALERIERSLG